MFLLDTMTVSALRQGRQVPEVATWVGSQATDALFVSAITLGEIVKGAEQARSRNLPFGLVLDLWAAKVEQDFGSRLLPVDVATVREWGRLAARIGNTSTDLIIAATALVHDLTVVTRNVRHFAPTGVRLFNPWDVNSPAHASGS